MSTRGLVIVLLCVTVALFFAQTCPGGSATWSENPVSGDWNTAANWRPSTVPNGPSDTAVFSASNIADLTTSTITEIDSIVFNPDTEPFCITAGVGTSLSITGTGVINQSQTVQSFGLEVTDETGSALFFYGSSTAGESTVFNNPGSYLAFHDNSNAGKASFTTTKLGVRQGDLIFWENATAAEATIATNGNSFTTFFDNTTAGKAVFTTSAGGRVLFSTRGCHAL